MKKIVALLVAIVLIATFSVTAFAAKSPEADPVFTVTVVDGAAGVVSTDKFTGETNLTLKANKDNGKFDSWTVYKADGKTLAVEGVDYIITSGSLENKTAVIKPLATLIVAGNYNGKKTDATIALKEDGKDDSNKSPQTGDALALTLVLVMFSAAACGFVAKKQLAK